MCEVPQNRFGRIIVAGAGYFGSMFLGRLNSNFGFKFNIESFLMLRK